MRNINIHAHAAAAAETVTVAVAVDSRCLIRRTAIMQTTRAEKGDAVLALPLSQVNGLMTFPRKSSWTSSANSSEAVARRHVGQKLAYAHAQFPCVRRSRARVWCAAHAGDRAAIKSDSKPAGPSRPASRLASATTSSSATIERERSRADHGGRSSSLL